MIQIIQIILYLGFVQGALLGVFLLSLKTNKISNRLLGLLTIFWGIIIGIFGLQYDGIYFKYPHLLKTFSLVQFAFFPLLYLQVKYLLSNISKFNRKDLIHFLPMFIMFLSYIDFYFISGEEKINHLNNSTYYYVLDVIYNEVLSVQGILYSIFALKLLSNYKIKIKDYQSNVDKTILKVQYIGISLSLIAWIIGIVGFHLYIFKIDINVDLSIFVYLTLVFIIYIISYTAIQSPEIFKIDENQIRVRFLKNKHKETQEKIDQIEETNDKMLEYIKKEKPYLNPELSLQDFADLLGEKRYFLSIVINRKHNKNFYEFINMYRVEEVKDMMSDPENKDSKLIYIALDAGFNSNASFYRIFKQMTNMTPSQYLSSQQAD